MRTLSILLAILVASHHDASAQPVTLEKNEINIGEYVLSFKKLSSEKRIKLTNTLLCIDEFDYTYLAGHIEDASSKCDEQILRAKSDRDSICENSKSEIRKRCKETEDSLKLDLHRVMKDYRDIETELKDTKTAHKSELFKHYIVEAVISVALLGVITATIVK